MDIKIGDLTRSIDIIYSPIRYIIRISPYHVDYYLRKVNHHFNNHESRLNYSHYISDEELYTDIFRELSGLK